MTQLDIAKKAAKEFGEALDEALECAYYVAEAGSLELGERRIREILPDLDAFQEMCQWLQEQTDLISQILGERQNVRI